MPNFFIFAVVRSSLLGGVPLQPVEDGLRDVGPSAVERGIEDHPGSLRAADLVVQSEATAPSPAEHGTAVHLEDLSRHERRLGGREVHHRRRDILRPASAPDEGL